MSDETPPNDVRADGSVAEPVRESNRSNRPSLVWLAPLIALAITLGIAWNSYSNRGPLIDLILESASGLEAGKTQLKHKDVEIGVVEDLGFTDDLSKVQAAIRIDKDLAPYFDQSAEFWVVRPEVSARGITGLDTVLSGPYLEVAWDGKRGESKRTYTALSSAPLSKPSDAGIRLRLRANDGGSMVKGAPVLYKRIEVGRIESKELSPDGERVDFNIFVDAPYDRLLTTATRFWDLSGVAVEIGTDGAKLQVDSLASLLQGGISFGTVATDGAPVEPMQSFILYSSEVEARRSVFSDDPASQLRLSIEFESSVRGLKIGAPVEYRGLRVGEVTDVAAKVQRNVDGVNDISLVVTIVISPSRLGLEPNDQSDSMAFMKRAVARGLRAQLKSASLLTGALYVELVEQPDAPIALLDELEDPYPRLPSVPSEFEDFTSSAEGVLNRINALPIEELLYSANDLLRNLNALATSDGTTAAPEELAALLRDARSLLNDPALRQAPKDLSATLAASRAIVENVQTADAAGALITALNDASAAAQAVSAASAGMPAMVASMRGIAENVQDLPLEDLVATATGLIASADKLVANEGMQAAPQALADALQALRDLLVDLKDADAAKNLSDALESVSVASAGMPALMVSLQGVTDNVKDLPLNDLVSTATTLLKDADKLVANEGMQAAPQALADALQALRDLLVDLKDADAAKNLSEALQAARDAATSISEAAAQTPNLIKRFEGIAANVEALPLDELLASTKSLLDDANRLIASEGLQQAPVALAETLDAARALLVDLQRADTGQKLADALVAAQGAAESFSGAVDGVPALTARLTQLAEKANSLPVEDLLNSATSLVQDADRLVASPGAQRIPDAVNQALDQVRSLVIELRQNGTAQNVNGALVSVAEASQSFQTLSQNLSVLIPKLVSVAETADSVLSTLDVGSELNYEAATALREVRDAARAITALAATVERRPNSLILGK